jgi:hypothetical protein
MSAAEAKTGRLPPASDANGPDVARITLRRAAEQAREALTDWVRVYQDEKDMAALAALDAALAEPDAKREPATVEQVNEAYKANYDNGWFSLIFFHAWREAERFHGIGATEQQPGAAGMSGPEADRVLTDALRKPCRYPACQDADGRCPRIFAGQCSGPGGVVA